MAIVSLMHRQKLQGAHSHYAHCAVVLFLLVVSESSDKRPLRGRKPTLSCRHSGEQTARTAVISAIVANRKRLALLAKRSSALGSRNISRDANSKLCHGMRACDRVVARLTTQVELAAKLFPRLCSFQLVCARYHRGRSCRSQRERRVIPEAFIRARRGSSRLLRSRRFRANVHPAERRGLLNATINNSRRYTPYCAAFFKTLGTRGRTPGRYKSPAEVDSGAASR